MVLRLADVITLAMQKGYWGSLQELLASLLTIGGLVYLKFSGGTILSLALVVVAPSCVARLALWSLIVVRQGVQYLPRWRHSSRDALNLVGRKGLVFFAGTWGELLVLQTPNIVIAQTMGAASVPLFAVPYQVFNSAYILLNTISAPLWPAYAEAKSGQDYDWIRRSHWRVMRETLALAIPGFVVLALIVRLFIRFWAGQPYVPSFLMAWLLALLFVIWSVNFVFVILLTGLGHIRERTYSVLAFGVINLALAIPFANLFGVTGIVVALLVAMTATQTWYLPWVLYHRERWVFLGPSETTFGKGKDGSIKR
jgi:O-antigen/teichoic acid export membrane protein